MPKFCVLSKRNNFLELLPTLGDNFGKASPVIGSLYLIVSSSKLFSNSRYNFDSLLFLDDNG